MGSFRRGRGKARTLGPRWENPIHHVRNLKLTYRDNGFNIATILGQTHYLFRGNGPYDPDFSGFGVQPYGYDQVAPLYNTYNVKASSIKVTASIQPAEGGPTQYVTCLVVPIRYRTSLTYQDLADLRAGGNYRSKIFSTDNGLTRKNVIRHYASTRRMYPEMTTQQEKFTAGFSTIPDLQWFWYIYFDTTTFGGVDTVINYDVEITYYMHAQREAPINES